MTTSSAVALLSSSRFAFCESAERTVRLGGAANFEFHAARVSSGRVVERYAPTACAPRIFLPGSFSNVFQIRRGELSIPLPSPFSARKPAQNARRLSKLRWFNFFHSLLPLRGIWIFFFKFMTGYRAMIPIICCVILFSCKNIGIECDSVCMLVYLQYIWHFYLNMRAKEREKIIIFEIMTSVNLNNLICLSQNFYKIFLCLKVIE